MLWWACHQFPAVSKTIAAPVVVAQGAATAVELHNLKKMVHIFQTEEGRLPTPEEFDTIVREKLNNKLKDPRLDTWRHPYIYRVAARKFEIRSAGPDGVPLSGDDIVITWEG